MHLATFSCLTYTLYLSGNRASWCVVSESLGSEDVEDGLLVEFSFTVCTVHVSVEGLNLGSDGSEPVEDIQEVVATTNGEVVEEISDFLLCLLSDCCSHLKIGGFVNNGLRHDLVGDAGVDGSGRNATIIVISESLGSEDVEDGLLDEFT